VKAIDNKGGAKYTEIATVVLERVAGIKLISGLILPNQVAQLQFTSQQAGKYNIRLINSLGQVSYKENITYAGGSGYKNIPLPSQLAGSIYQLEVLSPDGER